MVAAWGVPSKRYTSKIMYNTYLAVVDEFYKMRTFSLPLGIMCIFLSLCGLLTGRFCHGDVGSTVVSFFNRLIHI